MSSTMLLLLALLALGSIECRHKRRQFPEPELPKPFHSYQSQGSMNTYIMESLSAQMTQYHDSGVNAQRSDYVMAEGNMSEILFFDENQKFSYHYDNLLEEAFCEVEELDFIDVDQDAEFDDATYMGIGSVNGIKCDWWQVQVAFLLADRYYNEKTGVLVREVVQFRLDLLEQFLAELMHEMFSDKPSNLGTDEKRWWGSTDEGTDYETDYETDFDSDGESPTAFGIIVFDYSKMIPKLPPADTWDIPTECEEEMRRIKRHSKRSIPKTKVRKELSLPMTLVKAMRNSRK